MGWYGTFNTNNPLSGSAGSHRGQQGPSSGVINGETLVNHSFAIAPAELTIQEPPNHVIVNGQGTFKFAYGLTGSIGDTLTTAAHGHNFHTAIIKASDATEPVKLEISPSAWNGTGTTSPGDVTFVYKKGKG
tara:strand:- start:1395 stop:1790 length:396 start_codon:yes stop_codon:yes gene_type:complete